MKKILVADDNMDILESTAMLLELRDFAVVAVGDGTTILETVRKERPDAILQDIHMPGLDLEAHLRALRADPDVCETPVLLFTASANAPEEWLSHGADGFVRKPFDADRLKEVLDVAVRDGREGAKAGAMVA